MLSPKSQNPLKFGILLRWLSAHDSSTFTANIKWLDWIITNFKPGDTLSINDALTKLGEFEQEFNKISSSGGKIRSKAGRRKFITELPIFLKEGDSRNQVLRILDIAVEKNSKISITFNEIQLILSSIISSIAPTISAKDIIDSYVGAGKWVEMISPGISCFYDNLSNTANRGDIGAVAVADALSLLVEPYSYEFGYSIEDESKVEGLYKRLLKFKKEDKIGTGFLPGGDVPLCQVPIVESTAIASIALCNYYSYLSEINKTRQLDEVNSEITTTVKWLLNSQFEPGYWSTYKSDDYKSYPDVQATQVALVALSINPVPDTLTNQSIKYSISFLRDRQTSGGWGYNFHKEYNSIATLRILWALITLSEMYDVKDLIETAVQSLKSNLKITEKYHIEEIYIPHDGTRSRSSIKWYIPVKPFIISTLLRYYIYFKAGSIDEDMQKFIYDGIMEILLSQQEFGGWFGTEDGIAEYPAPSSTYYHARTLILKAMQDYTYLKQALKVKW